MPPVEPIIAWARRKFKAIEEETAKRSGGAAPTEADYRAIGWAVALKIKDRGTDATNFLKRAVESVGESLKSTLPDMVRRKIKFRFKIGGR